MKKNILSYILLLVISISGYFLYNYVNSGIYSDYSPIVLLIIVLLMLFSFFLSEQGKSLFGFLKGVKAEFGKIYFPKLNESLRGLVVVFVFCLFFLVTIATMDHFFLKLYNTLM